MNYLVAAYLIGFGLIGGYVVYLARRVKGLSDEIDDLRRPQG